jgi:hypothetical protein
MPSGGPKDSTPPQVVKSYPANKTTQFVDNKVVLHFDEFVELDQPLKTIFVSPYTAQPVETSIIGKKVIVEFPEGLKSNTTYSINFEQAIKDFKEGNFLPSYELNFSTGPQLDSGKLIIATKDSRTKSHSDFTKVCLVKNKSDFFGKNYKYVAKSKTGSASFNNLNNDKYYVFAFIDSNSNMKWEKTEPIGFLSEKVEAGKAQPEIKTFLQEQPKTIFTITTKSPNEYDLTTSQDIHFPEIMDTNANLVYVNARTFKLLTKASFQKQLIRLRYNNDQYDTLELAPTKGQKQIEKLIAGDDRMSLIYRFDTLELAFNSYLSKIDTSKIKLKEGEKLKPLNATITKNKLVLTGLEPGKAYTLALDSQALGYASSYNKPLTISLVTYPLEKRFDIIRITLDPNIAANKKAKLFQIADNRWVPLAKEAKIELKNIYGDEIKFYILIDENNDGIWTTGNVEKVIQPETLYLETITIEAKKKDYILKISNP